MLPISAGLAGVLLGPSIADAAGVPIDLDSHYRYLSGLLLAIGLAFWGMIPTIERRGAEFRLLTLVVFVGGLGRLFSLAAVGAPSLAMKCGLAMELVVTPLLCLWQSALRGRPVGEGGVSRTTRETP